MYLLYTKLIEIHYKMRSIISCHTHVLSSEYITSYIISITLINIYIYIWMTTQITLLTIISTIDIITQCIQTTNNFINYYFVYRYHNAIYTNDPHH